jgi:hypothetical protein
MPNIEYFTPDVTTAASAGAVSAAVALPNSADALLLLTNLGALTAFFKLGTTNAVTVTASTGTALMPGQSLIVGAQGMSYIAFIGTGSVGNSATINMTSGN